jgi:hypothetical protein
MACILRASTRAACRLMSCALQASAAFWRSSLCVGLTEVHFRAFLLRRLMCEGIGLAGDDEAGEDDGAVTEALRQGLSGDGTAGA